MLYTYIESPIGELLLAGSASTLEVLGFATGNKARRAESEWQRDDHAFDNAKAQLEEFFGGERHAFDLELSHSGTQFQRAVLDALQQIPYGETRSYKEIAEQIGRPKAVRAVGAANGSNPIPIIIPCHRVIGANGALTGFGGGIATKQYLLDLERRHSGLFG
ncbi:MAG: methylated-DNA--[protein]-cysteine S-methyltransferase [Proteobacteria bacterium]|nr:methylated-DNA--[protein]-cysteine S-methyltransferase [Pseudomonadota bacterium]